MEGDSHQVALSFRRRPPKNAVSTPFSAASTARRSSIARQTRILLIIIGLIGCRLDGCCRNGGLSSSPMALNQYVICGLSQLVELGIDGTLMDHIILERRQQQWQYMSSITRLKIGHQVATALAHLHTIDNNGDVDNTTMIRQYDHDSFCRSQ